MKSVLHLTTLLWFLLAFITAQAAPLPASVLQELRKANIPIDAVAIEVREAGKLSPPVSYTHLTLPTILRV